MKTGEKIRKIRKQQKLSMKELGKRIGLSEQAISQYERGVRNISLEVLYAIANALNVSIEDLTQTKKVTVQAKSLCKAVVNGFEISGLSKDEFCNKVNISENELERYIQGISIPPLKLIECVSNLTNLNLNELTNLSEQSENDIKSDFIKLSKDFADIFETLGMKLTAKKENPRDKNCPIKITLEDTKNGYSKEFKSIEEAKNFMEGIKFMMLTNRI